MNDFPEDDLDKAIAKLAASNVHPGLTARQYAQAGPLAKQIGAKLTILEMSGPRKFALEKSGRLMYFQWFDRLMAYLMKEVAWYNEK